MTEFSKPLLTEEAPEPPLVEQKPLEHENERLKQTLATIQGATAKVEEAGLAPKPVAVAAKPKAKEKAGVAKGEPRPKPLLKPKPDLKVEPEPEKPATGKIPGAAKEKATKPVDELPQPEPGKDLPWRQSAVSEAVGSMAGNPDPDVFHRLFKLFANAPEKEIPAAAMILSTAYLRTPATKRQPVLKALQPALRAFRSTKLAALISARLGAALVAKPPAPPPAPPGG
jgi:hypothetical protein